VLDMPSCGENSPGLHGTKHSAALVRPGAMVRSVGVLSRASPAWVAVATFAASTGHTSQEVAPSVAENVCSGHTWHAGVPAAAAKLPGAHGMQSVAAASGA